MYFINFHQMESLISSSSIARIRLISKRPNKVVSPPTPEFLEYQTMDIVRNPNEAENSLGLTHIEPLRGALHIMRSQDSEVGIAAGYRLNDRGVGVLVPVGSRIFSSPLVVQTSFVVHPTSYPMATVGKVVRA
jgi:hypothetical protein